MIDFYRFCWLIIWFTYKSWFCPPALCALHTGARRNWLDQVPPEGFNFFLWFPTKCKFFFLKAPELFQVRCPAQHSKGLIKLWNVQPGVNLHGYGSSKSLEMCCSGLVLVLVSGLLVWVKRQVFWLMALYELEDSKYCESWVQEKGKWVAGS